MARYEHLPIYKAALDAAVHFEQVVAGFSRYHKYSLGTELRQASRGVIQQVIRANAARERLPQLLKLRDDLEAVLVLLRLAKEVKAFKSFQAYQHATELVVSVCRQNEGWIKSVAQGAPESSPRRRDSRSGVTGFRPGAE
jgi:hypothetical protein